MKKFTMLARVSGVTILLALVAGFTSEVRAQNGAKGGGTRLIAGPESKASVAAVVESKAMACPKCKEEYSSRVDLSARGANKPTVFVVKHLCDGCGTEWNVVGHGKSKVSVATHTCNSCGSASAGCCAKE